MRISPITLLTAAVTFALPVTARSQALELPCAGYATFETNGSNTALIGLALGDVPAGAKVTLTCSGSDCPFASRSITMGNDVKILALTDMFRDPNFKPGTILELRVTKPHWIGKLFRYEILSPTEQPKATTQCLGAEDGKPTVCLKQVGSVRQN